MVNFFLTQFLSGCPLPDRQNHLPCATLDFLGSVHAFGELGRAKNGVAPYAVFFCYGFDGARFVPILGTNLFGGMLVMPLDVFYRHFLRFVLPSDQIRFLGICQVALVRQTFVHNAQNCNYSVTKCSKTWISVIILNFPTIYAIINLRFE